MTFDASFMGSKKGSTEAPVKRRCKVAGRTEEEATDAIRQNYDQRSGLRLVEIEREKE